MQHTTNLQRLMCLVYNVPPVFNRYRLNSMFAALCKQRREKGKVGDNKPGHGTHIKRLVHQNCITNYMVKSINSANILLSTFILSLLLMVCALPLSSN